MSAVYTEAEYQAAVARIRAEDREKADERVRVAVAKALADRQAAERANPPDKALLQEELLAAEVTPDQRDEDNEYVLLAA